MIKVARIILVLLGTVFLTTLASSQTGEVAVDPPTAAEPADPIEISRLVEGLKGWDREKVQANADTLARIGEPAVPALIEALKDEDPGVRSNAARVLGDIEAPEAAVPLGELLNDSKHWVTRSAVYALGNIGTPEAVVLLKKALTHYRGQVQEAALWGLDELQEQSAIGEISDLMVSASDQYVRWRALYALRSLKEGEEISFLIKTLGSPEADVGRRRNSAVILGNLEIEQAGDVLLKVLDAKDAGIRWRAIEALSKIGSPTARPAIEARLSDPDGDVRLFAIGALGVLGQKESVKPLKELLSGSATEIRMNTVRSLKKIGGDEAVEAICEALADRNSNLRTMAVESLAELEAVKASKKIALLAKDQSPSVRSAVMRALGELAPDSSRGILETGKTDDNNWVRYEAERALKKLSGED